MKEKKQVTVLGHFGGDKVFLDGQTVKIKTITAGLIEYLGADQVMTIDTYGWKKRPFNLLRKIWSTVKTESNLIIFPAQNGVQVFPPLLTVLNFRKKTKLYYIVIGGWLPEFLQSRLWLVRVLKKFDQIYVETHSMIESLKKLGLLNVSYLPNCKKLEIVNSEELVYNQEEPYKLCTFSRVIKEKGIEDAIWAVKTVNKHYSRTVYKLDIYGQIEKSYEREFREVIGHAPDYIQYIGCVDYGKSTEVIRNYNALLFPTYYSGEGFAGTLIDAFAAGVPVLASNWKYNREIVTSGYNGYIFNDKEELVTVLMDEEIMKRCNEMKTNCLITADQYRVEKVILDLINVL